MAYIEKPPFLVKIKEHAKVSTMVRRSNRKAPKPPEKIKVEPSVAPKPPSYPLEKYLLYHENDLHMQERNEIDRILFEQQPLLKHNFPIETLGGPPPPKGDPVFELKQLPGTLKYAYLDEKKIYLVIISANLSEHEEERLLMILRASVPLYVSTRLIWNLMLNPLLIINDD